MTRNEIIEKVERMMQYNYDELNKYGNRSHTKAIAQRGLTQLDTLFILLDEKWDGYDEWFEKFYKYL